MSQTALKELEDIFMCERYWYEKWINRSFTSEPNIHMLRGSYFEYLAIGGGATRDDTTDLPRLKNGEKSTDQLRIEEQAETFKKLFDPTSDGFVGLTIVDTQIHMETDDRQGTLDFTVRVPDKPTGYRRIGIVDLKLTGSIENPKSKWNSYNRNNADYLQQIHYKELWKNIYHDDPKMYMAVFDYSPRKKYTIYELNITDADIQHYEMRFDRGLKRVEGFMEKYPGVRPDESICKKCPLQCDWRLAKYVE